MVKGMVKTLVGASLIGSVLGGIGSAGMGAIGSATQSLVSIGFMGHAIKNSGASKIFKWWTMPLTNKGKEMLNILIKSCGKEKGRRIFYSLEKKKPDWTKSWREEWTRKQNQNQDGEGVKLW